MSLTDAFNLSIRNVISSKNHSKYTKKLQTKISPFKFGSAYVKNNGVIKKGWSTKKIFLPNCSRIDSRRSHTISKRFDEKQKNWQS